MPILIGIDEAGYGPLLGPLVVGASVWETSAASLGDDFWDALQTCVCRDAGRGEWRLRIGDSKDVFDRHKGIATLERTVLAFAEAIDLPRDTVAGLLAALRGAPHAPSESVPWYNNMQHPLPLDRVGSAVGATAQRLREQMAASGVVCRGLLAQVVTEDAYNQRVHHTRNKAAVLIEQILRLLCRVIDHYPQDELHIVVDRLGGRADYRALLMQAFPQRRLHVLDVSDACSRYRLVAGDDTPRNGAAAGDWFFHFTVEADQQYLPVALGSMVAKYIRELLMEQFNAFWRHYVPQLQPTAGYYKDAQRFLDDIASALATTGLSREMFVRQR